MDINDLRTIVTIISFIVFAGIVYWAFSNRQRARFDEAANLPFVDSDVPVESIVDEASKSPATTNCYSARWPTTFSSS